METRSPARKETKSIISIRNLASALEKMMPSQESSEKADMMVKKLKRNIIEYEEEYGNKIIDAYSLALEIRGVTSSNGSDYSQAVETLYRDVFNPSNPGYAVLEESAEGRVIITMLEKAGRLVRQC